MEFQQRLSARSFGAVVIVAGGTKLEDLHEVGDVLRKAVATIAPGEVVNVTR